MRRPAPPTNAFVPLTLRTDTGAAVTIQPPRAELEEAAMRWCYIVRNRRRWCNGRSADRVAQECRRVLAQLGVSDETLRTLAHAELLEVSVPQRSNVDDWAARAFPWEYVLSAATEAVRGGRRLTVVRTLTVKASRRRHRAGRPACCSSRVGRPGWTRFTRLPQSCA